MSRFSSSRYLSVGRFYFAPALLVGAALFLLVPPPTLYGPALRADDVEPADLDVPYEPSHPRVARAMLEAAKVGPEDVLWDLGCGDGRIAIMAVHKFKARRAVCVDLSAQRLKEAREKARHYGVENRITFIEGDIFKQNLESATVVTMYLLVSINRKLRPQLFRQLKPGTRLVSHAFDMTEWKADRIIKHNKARNKTIYYWVMPADLAGTWNWSTEYDKTRTTESMSLRQTFQRVEGSFRLKYGAVPIAESRVDGAKVELEATTTADGQSYAVLYEGRANGDRIEGTQKWRRGTRVERVLPWSATRISK